MADSSWPPTPLSSPEVVAIAASAGGLGALIAVLGALPARFPAAVLVAQHRAEGPTDLLAGLLRPHCALPVEFARDGEPAAPGAIRVAPAGRHLEVQGDRTLAVSDAPRVRFVRPSADLLFETAAEAFRSRTVAVVLSGTGDDGARGVAAVRRHGGLVIAQDAESAEHPEMPLAALEVGAVDAVLPLASIGPALVALVLRGGVAAGTEQV